MTDLGIFLADANQDTMLTINGIDTELKDFETIYQVSSFLNANFDDELLAEVGEDGLGQRRLRQRWRLRLFPCALHRSPLLALSRLVQLCRCR